ncbi:MAG: hypothetical protein AAFY77_06245 [Pseudomonadota bacterium]
MIQVVGLFLIAMLVLAVMGRFRRNGPTLSKRKKCKACGRYLIGKGDCPCGKGG